MYLAQYKSLNKKQFCEMNEVNEQKLFFVMIYDVLNTLFKWVVTNVIYTTTVLIIKKHVWESKLFLTRHDSTELFKIFFSLLTLQLLFCKKLVGREKINSELRQIPNILDTR